MLQITYRYLMAKFHKFRLLFSPWSKISLKDFTSQYAADKGLTLSEAKECEREFKRFIFLVRESPLPLGLRPGPVLDYWTELAKPRFGGLYKKYCSEVLKRELNCQVRVCDEVTYSWTWTAYRDTFGSPSRFVWEQPNIKSLAIAGHLFHSNRKADTDVWDVRRVKKLRFN